MLLGVIGIQLLITGSFVKVPYNEDLFTFYYLYLFLTKLNVMLGHFIILNTHY